MDPGKGRTYYVKRNIMFGALNQAVGLGIPFLVRTVLIDRLGGEYLGLNSLFTSILQVFNMADLGFSSAVTYRLYKPLAQNDGAFVCALMGFYRKVYKIIGTVILAVGLMLMPFLPFFIKGSPPDGIRIHFLYLMYLINTSVSYLFFAYKAALLEASQRQDILSNLNSAVTTVRAIAQIFMLAVPGSYYLYVACLPVFGIAYNLLVAFATDKLYPGYVCRGQLSKEETTAIYTQVKGLMIGKVGVISRNSFDTVIISSFYGLVDAAVYSNYYYILLAVLGIVTVITNAMRGSVGNSIAVETKEKNYNDFIKFNYFAAWLGSWCTVCLFCLYQPFMQLWVKEKLMAPDYTMFLFCVYFYISQSGQMRAVYSSAAGLWWELRYLQVGEMVTNFVLNFLLGYFFGMEGVLYATIISVSVFSIIGIGKITMQCCFKVNAAGYFMEMLKYAVVTVIAAAVTYHICSFVSGEQYLRVLIIRGCICCIVPNALFLLFSLCSRKYRGYLAYAVALGAGKWQ